MTHQIGPGETYSCYGADAQILISTAWNPGIGSTGGISHLLELGAGTGIMAADLLLELRTLDSLPERYAILELSGELPLQGFAFRDERGRLQRSRRGGFPLRNLPAGPRRNGAGYVQSFSE
jgi:hypothetical protein